MVNSTGPAIAQYHLLLMDDLRLNKQIAESGMRGVGSSQCENHFCITCQVDYLLLDKENQVAFPFLRQRLDNSARPCLSG
jgi:hypothetical protein